MFPKTLRAISETSGTRSFKSVTYTGYLTKISPNRSSSYRPSQKIRSSAWWNCRREDEAVVEIHWSREWATCLSLMMVGILARRQQPWIRILGNSHLDTESPFCSVLTIRSSDLYSTKPVGIQSHARNSLGGAHLSMRLEILPNVRLA